MSEDEIPEWVTEMDLEILDVLGTELILTPSVIADNIDRSRQGVGNRLSSLQAGGLVKKLDRGRYKITEQGLKLTSNEWKYITTFDEEAEYEVAVKVENEDEIEEIEDIVGHEIHIERREE